MSRRIDPQFQELLCASLLVFLPSHRNFGLSQAKAVQRLTKAIDLPRGTLKGWPVECADLVIRAQLTIDGQPGGIDKASIQAATDAKWPVRYGWQSRRDIGDGCEDMAA